MKILSYVNTIVLLALAAYIIFQKSTEKKTVFVNNGQLFSEFKMTKELEENLKKLEQSRQFILDSLISEIKLAEREKNQEKFSSVKNVYLKQREMFANEMDREKKAYT